MLRPNNTNLPQKITGLADKTVFCMLSILPISTRGYILKLNLRNLMPGESLNFIMENILLINKMISSLGAPIRHVHIHNTMIVHLVTALATGQII